MVETIEKVIERTIQKIDEERYLDWDEREIVNRDPYYERVENYGISDNDFYRLSDADKRGY